MNLILLVVDTLRYDHIGANGNEWVHTPNLDRFADQATVFDNCYAASYPTIPHRTDVITGRYGAPFHPWLPLRYDAVTLPRTLGEHGYATQLLHDTPHLVNGGHNFDYPFHAWHFVRGNEVDRHWLDDRDADLPQAVRRNLTDAKGRLNKTAMQYIRNNRRRSREDQWPSPRLFAAASRWLEDNRRRDNFFLWIDCFDPHEPWDPPPHYIERYAPDFRERGDLDLRFGWESTRPQPLEDHELERLRAHYAGEVTMLDAWFGRMLDTLELTGLADHTAIVVHTDHGTNLGAHDQLHKGYPLWDQVSHALLMARVPGQRGGIRRSEVVQPQDVFPTLCELTGAEVPEVVEGHSFAPMLGTEAAARWPRQVALSSNARDLRQEQPPVISVNDAQWCLLDSPDPQHRGLYHKPSDPAEESDVLADHPEVYERLHEALLAELDHRGAPQMLTRWFATGQRGPLPQGYLPRDPYLEAYTQYWNFILPEER
ncbi:MAG: sulfatase [Candidatus Brocadiia bacterium]